MEGTEDIKELKIQLDASKDKIIYLEKNQKSEGILQRLSFR